MEAKCPHCGADVVLKNTPPSVINKGICPGCGKTVSKVR